MGFDLGAMLRDVSKLDTNRNAAWNTGHPQAPGQYIAYYCLNLDCKDVDMLHWSGKSWWLGKCEFTEDDGIHVLCWSEVPKEHLPTQTQA